VKRLLQNNYINPLCQISLGRDLGDVPPPPPPGASRLGVRQVYLRQSVLEVALQKSIPEQIRQLIFHLSNSKG